MKLLTKAIEKALVSAAERNEAGKMMDPIDANAMKVIVKFFMPEGAATWYILEGAKQPDGDWRLFGFCNLGDPDMAELGYVMLSELRVRGKNFGLPVERDMWYEGTLADARKEVSRS